MTSKMRSRDRDSSNLVKIECQKCRSHFMGDADHQFCAICVEEVAGQIATEQRQPSAPLKRRLTRYTPHLNGAAYCGMFKETHNALNSYGPHHDETGGPFVLASEADAAIESLQAELAKERTAYARSTALAVIERKAREHLSREPAITPVEYRGLAYAETQLTAETGIKHERVYRGPGYLEDHGYIPEGSAAEREKP